MSDESNWFQKALENIDEGKDWKTDLDKTEEKEENHLN